MKKILAFYIKEKCLVSLTVIVNLNSSEIMRRKENSIMRNKSGRGSRKLRIHIYSLFKGSDAYKEYLLDIEENILQKLIS